MKNNYIFSEDYCLCMVAHPNFYKHYCGWEPETSDNECGEYKKYREKTIRYFWNNNASYEPTIGTMLISKKATNPELEYVYAPYIPVVRSEEESKLYKHMRRTVGCINECFFGKGIPPIGQCNKCYEAALNQEKI